MSIKPVYVVNDHVGAIPKWVQESRANRGLDPQTGRKLVAPPAGSPAGTPPAVAPSKVAPVFALLAMLGGIGLFVWFCVAIIITIASS